jgi:hypothetical protein
MRPIRDALELLTAAHEEIDELLDNVQQTRDVEAFDLLTARLVAHLAVEQERFYPVVAATLSREVLAEVLAEHAAIKRVLAELVWLGVDDPAFGEKLIELAQLLAGHAGWQEDELFHTLAETMSVEALAALGTDLQGFESAFPIAA